MRKWQLVGALSVGIMASGTGFIQAQAADYTFFVDFDTKQVANFDNFTQTFFDTTAGISGNITMTVNLQYRMNACPPSIAQDVALNARYRLNATGTFYSNLVDLPDMPCSVVDTNYQIISSVSILSEHVQYLMFDDANYLNFTPTLLIYSNAFAPGRVITITDLEMVFTLNYDFNTTYLFNYFLSDTDYLTTNVGGPITTSYVILNDFDYVMTTAGNDRFFIINSSSTDYGTSRNRFAVDYNMEYFRGESIGARYKTIYDGTIIYTNGSNGSFITQYNYYYLNAANNTQPIVNVPEFNFEYEDCGSFLALNVGCFINNAFAYITNDAPIISDAITLLNAGMALAGQAFGVIGSFTDDNVFGVLILGGLGLIAVRWFLKND